jgi:predicted CoA-binding protein
MSTPVERFLAGKRIAVAGVSRSGDQPANSICRKLLGAGYEVFQVNPKTEWVDGARCYSSLAAIPGGVDGVVAATHPRDTVGVVRECAKLGVPRVWMHRSFGQGSVSEEAVALCREEGIEVIAGGCPMMFCPPVDLGHRCMRWVLKLAGGLPDGATG